MVMEIVLAAVLAVASLFGVGYSGVGEGHTEHGQGLGLGHEKHADVVTCGGCDIPDCTCTPPCTPPCSGGGGGGGF